MVCPLDESERIKDMSKSLIMIVVLYLLILPATQAQAKADNNAVVNNKPGAPTITITRLDVNDTTLELSYEIENDSGQDVWILMALDRTGATTSVFMDEDDRTLLIRRRLDVPARPERASFPTCNGRYLRLCAGRIQSESVSLAIPVHPKHGLGVGGRKARGLEYATRLAIEIGYYSGDLPGMVRRIIEEDEKNPRIIPVVDRYYTNTISGWFGGLVGFNKLNELVRSRDDEVLIPFTSQAFTGEKVLRITVDDLHIPYEEKVDLTTGRYPPDLTACTRVEIQYQPTMLEYFFPYAGEQSLLSPAEKEYLQFMKTIVVENPDNLKTLADDVNERIRASGIVRQRSVADVVCYREDERLMSFAIYNDDSIVTEGRYRFRCPNGLRSLRMLTPQVHPIELRVKCAANLKDLWHRFRLYEKASKSLLWYFFWRRERPYPAPDKWCDSMVRAYRRATEMSDKYIMRPHICPSAGQDKCHYAMNRNCKSDSPPEMVLLFETKAGWNQHGGSELFTFDNHDPRGGCVVLNNGTVKFIRTKKELQQLRWK